MLCVARCVQCALLHVVCSALFYRNRSLTFAAHVAELVSNQRRIGSRVIWVRAGAASTASWCTCHTKPEAPNVFSDVVAKVWIIYSKVSGVELLNTSVFWKCLFVDIMCSCRSFCLFFLTCVSGILLFLRAYFLANVGALWKLRTQLRTNVVPGP